MSGPGNDSEKPRRVSFALPNSLDSSGTHARPNLSYTNSPTKPTTNNHKTRPGPQTHSNTNKNSGASYNTAPLPVISPDLATSTVKNTPEGLVIDGVLRPRGAAGHTDINGYQPQPQPQLFPNYTCNPSAPPHFNYTAYPYQQVNMSTVGSGITPDPNALHYQPPVPDTTNGPYQYTYVPRSDPVGPQYAVPQGFGAGTGGPAFYTPAGIPYQQTHQGMATTPMPMMPQGYHAMPGSTINMQPGAMPPMAGVGPAPAPNGPVYMTAGYGQPTPPITPPAAAFTGGGNPGFEMGKTKSEIEAENQANAVHNQVNEPQEMKPADDDPSRMYWARELDGNWTTRNRFSLDQMGNFRWYVLENGVFYAKMLPE